MKNYIKSSLTVKLSFLITFALVGISILICVLFAVVMPTSFSEVQSQNLQQKVEEMVAEISSQNEDEVFETIHVFALQNNVVINIYDHEHLVIGIGYDNTIAYDGDYFQYNVTDKTPNSTIGNNVRYPIKMGDKNYNMIVIGGETETINEVTAVIKKIIPYILLLACIVGIVISWCLSKYITSPIKKLRDKTKKIASLDFEVSYDTKRQDEFGELSEDINFLAKELGTTVKRLNAELALEKELEQKQRLFFASASHELKTPLTVIKNKLEGMIYGYGNYKDHDVYLPSTLKTVGQTERLINDILLVSQMEELVLNETEIGLKELINSVLENYSELIEFKKLKVECFLNEKTIVGDEKQLQKVIENIIGNAVQYTNDGELIEIILNGENLSVENYGVSISKEEISKLCDPFYRIEKSRNRKTGGSGLGLHFVKNILDKHNLHFEIQVKERSFLFLIKLH